MFILVVCVVTVPIIIVMREHQQQEHFVYWTAQSLIHAEERNIDQLDSNEMPLVDTFGLDLKRMFRDAIYAVGNYDEVYQRNLATILPRDGRNRLLQNENGGNTPLRYIPPGFVISPVGQA